MYGDSEHDKLKTLFAARYYWVDKCNANRVKAEEKLATETIANDHRFAEYDPHKLAERVERACCNGSEVDLKDPELLKGGKARPGGGLMSSKMRPSGW